MDTGQLGVDTLVPMRLAHLLCLVSLIGLGSMTKSVWAELPGGIRVSAQVEPSTLHPGQTARLDVTVHLPSGWIIYDLEQVPNSVLPAEVELDPHDDIAALEAFRSEGAKEDREPKFGQRLARFFDRTPTFSRPVVVSADPRLGRHELTGRIAFLVQHRPSKRFYVVSKAYFSAAVTVGLPEPTTSTDVAPAPALTETELEPVAVQALMEADKPQIRPPVPPFTFAVDPILPPREPAKGTGTLFNGIVAAAGLVLSLLFGRIFYLV